MSFYPACGANWCQLLLRRSRAWNFSFNIILKYRYALCKTRQKNTIVRYSCHRISNNWQLRWSTNDQVKNMVAAMSVHGQRVQFVYSSLDTPIFSAHVTCAIITLATHMFQIKPSWDSWVRIVDARSSPVEETGTKHENSSCTSVSLINRTDKLSCPVWLRSVVSSVGMEKYLHWDISESICFCMAKPIKGIIWFCPLQLKNEALRGAFETRPDVCLSSASPRSLKAALKTPSLQSVSFSENAAASLWPLNGVSRRPQNSIVLMISERRFRFSSTAFCRLLFKAFRTSLDLSASVCTKLSNMAAHTLW